MGREELPHCARSVDVVVSAGDRASGPVQMASVVRTAQGDVGAQAIVLLAASHCPRLARRVAVDKRGDGLARAAIVVDEVHERLDGGLVQNARVVHAVVLDDVHRTRRAALASDLRNGPRAGARHGADGRKHVGGIACKSSLYFFVIMIFFRLFHGEKNIKNLIKIIN